jgi:perosamine synthetase
MTPEKAFETITGRPSRGTRRMVPVSSADLRGNELAYVSDCIASGWLTQGPYVERFEAELARVTAAKYALACSSGTAALHLAYLAAGVGPDSTVIVPVLTYVATANAAKYCGARVVFADIDRHSWCLSYDSIGVTSDLVVPVDLFDTRCMVGGPRTVRDVAHSGMLGSSTISAMSFYASKIIACGEGGAVLTDREWLRNTVYALRGQGATSQRYYHDRIGYNYRMTELSAAVGLAQLERLDEMLAARRRAYNLYCAALRAAGFVERGGEFQGGERSSAWTFACLLPPDVNRDAIISRLSDHSIESRPFFVPLNELPMYRDSGGPPTPIAAEVSRRGICLPLYSGISDSDVEYVCERLMAGVAR